VLNSLTTKITAKAIDVNDIFVDVSVTPATITSTYYVLIVDTMYG